MLNGQSVSNTFTYNLKPNPWRKTLIISKSNESVQNLFMQAKHISEYNIIAIDKFGNSSDSQI